MNYIERKVGINRIQKSQLCFDTLYSYYDNIENHNNITVVYDEEIYCGFINDRLFKFCENEEDFWYYCVRAAKELTIDKAQKNNFEEIECRISSFWMGPCSMVYIKDSNIIIEPEEETFINIKNLSIIRNDLRKILEKENVSVYCVNIGNKRDKGYYVPNSTNETSLPMFWSEMSRKYSEKKLANIIESDIESTIKKHEKMKFIKSYSDDKNKTLYIVGPCIAMGWPYTANIDELAYMLAMRLKNYRVVKVQGGYHYNSYSTEILEYNIYEEDIVVFIDELDKNYIKIDLDLSQKIEERKEHPYYTISPIHTTVWGNRFVAEQIAKMLKCKDSGYLQESGTTICLHKGKKQLFNNDMLIKLKDFVDICKQKFVEKYGTDKWENRNGLDIGAISISANPFTKGHRFLIDYASQNADIIYIFVVHNEMLDFSYEIRRQLIEEGTKDIDNIIIIDGGDVVATIENFTSYYVRDKMQGKEISPIQDVELFAGYIAPQLGINKRFVGEEPIDYVTNNYNKQMNQMFPLYNIELIQIPRYKIKNEYVSASQVRKLYIEKNWDGIKQLVPDTTFTYLINNQNDIFNKRGLKPKYYSTRWLLNKLHNGENVVIYGTGRDAEFVFNMIPDQYKSKIIFCTSYLNDKKNMFHNTKVISKAMLKENDNIFIATRKYKKEIYKELLQKFDCKNVIEVTDFLEDEISWHKFMVVN